MQEQAPGSSPKPEGGDVCEHLGRLVLDNQTAQGWLPSGILEDSRSRFGHAVSGSLPVFTPVRSGALQTTIALSQEEADILNRLEGPNRWYLAAFQGSYVRAQYHIQKSRGAGQFINIPREIITNRSANEIYDLIQQGLLKGFYQQPNRDFYSPSMKITIKHISAENYHELARRATPIALERLLLDKSGCIFDPTQALKATYTQEGGLFVDPKMYHTLKTPHWACYYISLSVLLGKPIPRSYQASLVEGLNRLKTAPLCTISYNIYVLFRQGHGLKVFDILWNTGMISPFMSWMPVHDYKSVVDQCPSLKAFIREKLHAVDQIQGQINEEYFMAICLLPYVTSRPQERSAQEHIKRFRLDIPPEEAMRMDFIRGELSKIYEAFMARFTQQFSEGVGQGLYWRREMIGHQVRQTPVEEGMAYQARCFGNKIPRA